MTNEEREELRAALEAAGCHRLASRVCYFDDPMVAELRSLLRREGRLRTMEAGVRAADRLLDASAMTPVGEQRYGGSTPEDWETFWAASELLEAEVPDGQG